MKENICITKKSIFIDKIDQVNIPFCIRGCLFANVIQLESDSRKFKTDDGISFFLKMKLHEVVDLMDKLRILM